MPLQIVHQDITKIVCDAIVNPSDQCFSGGGGTDRAIHKAAGAALDEACCALAPIGMGEIAVTEGFHLPCRYILHTMGPIWLGGRENESVLLRSCYINALLEARQLGAKSIAFPLISSGTFGFPKDKVLRIAMDAISDFLFVADSDMDVYICVIDRSAYALSRDIALREYLAQSVDFSSAPICSYEASVKLSPAAPPQSANLADWISRQDDTFAVLLLKLIDKKGMDDVACYKRANVSKGTFWKIMNDGSYKPSKTTVIGFAISLELTLEETERLLKTAGFSLSHSNKFDLIIEFYISNGIYDMSEINAALYQYDQVCLGC